MNKDALKEVYLNGVTHADMSIFPIDSQDTVSSYDKQKYSATRVIKDGSIYVVQYQHDGDWSSCGWYVDKAKAIFAASSLAYCYGCEVIDITSQ